MGLLNLGGTKDKKRRSHIKNLISVALADGHLAPEEWDLLERIAKRLDMSNEEIEHIKNNPGEVKFVAPSKYTEKLQQVEDLVAVMRIDNDIDNNEMELCKKIALNLDLLPRVVNDIINETYHKVGKA